MDVDAISFVMADALRNANKYSPPGHVPTVELDYIDGHLVIKCKNATNPSRDKKLTKSEVARIFAREVRPSEVRRDELRSESMVIQ